MTLKPTSMSEYGSYPQLRCEVNQESQEAVEPGLCIRLSITR